MNRSQKEVKVEMVVLHLNYFTDPSLPSFDRAVHS